MGYTKFTKELVQGVLDKQDIKTVIDFGSANDYDIGGLYPPFIEGWYLAKGMKYACIDLAGDNGAHKFDVSNELLFAEEFDLVVDSGFSEHVVQMEGYETVSFHDGYIHSIYPTKIKNIELGFYNCWLNKHNLLKIGGVMVNENPLSGNWPGHAYSYLGETFYHYLIKYLDYEIIETGTHPSMGNNIDGWNLYAVLVKHSKKFPTFEEFKTLPILPA
jgi:hypothetical protein